MLVRQAKDADDLRRLVSVWANDPQLFDQLTDLLYTPIAKADMAGQLFVATIEVPAKLKNPPKQLRFDSPAHRLFTHSETFLSLPFDEAVEFFRERYWSNPEDLTKVLEAYRKRARGASAKALENLARAVTNHLDSTLRQGGTLADFVESFAPRTNESGGQNLTAELGMSRSYLETVYRTNIATAYGAGRVKEIEKVKEVFPYVQYRTAGDSRVRDLHVELDRKTWRQDDGAWRHYAPPNGFNCRCAIVLLDEEDVDEAELSRRIVTMPDPGFGGPPTELIERTL